MQDVPRELAGPPLPLAALVGASPDLSSRLTEALHESGLAAHQQKTVKYLSFSYDMRIPPCKRGGKDSPSYRVGGLLKYKWLQKVCGTVPAVLVVCFDWSADPELSQEDEKQAISHLQRVRREARERELRVLLFAVLPEGTKDAANQCQALRRQPEGPGLIVACGMGEVLQKAVKLERLIYQNVMYFYADEEKRHKKALTPRLAASMPRWANSALQVRATLKVGFLAEFRHDPRAAMKNYIKAYEQLMKDKEIADPVERLGLSNYLSIRMYHLYLQSHEVNSAVHHCKIHVNFLRSTCKEGDELLAWRRWHWLALSHQIFAEIIESAAQQIPDLIDQSDMWQFPGFHYQAAASYVSRLQHWAREASSGGTLPPASGAGGDLLPAPFVGQADVLERPEECSDPTREVYLRDAHAQASSVKHGDRKLQLLTRAQAACKERSYAAGEAVCLCRTADEYLVQGNMVASTKLYERLRGCPTGAEHRQLGPWPQWPLLRRFALERAILCSCRDLGLQKEPAICFGTRALQAPATCVGAQSEAAKESQEDSEAKAAAARKRLLLDAFEYLALPSVARAGIDCSPTGELQAQLLDAVKGVWSAPGAASGGTSVEVALEGAVAEISFPEDEEEGSPTAASGFSVSLRSPLSVAVEVGSLVAVTSHGDVALTPTAGAQTTSWPSGGLLVARGAWPPAPAASASGGACRITAVRLSWAAAPAVVLLVQGLRSPGHPEPLVPPFYAPSMTAPAWLGSRLSPDGIPRLAAHAGHKLRAEVLTPVGPTTALACEPYVFHLVVFSSSPKRPSGAAGSPWRLQLSSRVHYREDADDAGASGRGVGERCVGLLSRPAVASLAPTQGGGDDLLLPLPEDGTGGRVVAELSSDGQFRLASGPAVVALPAEQLVGVPLSWDAKTEHPLAIPIVVRSACSCQVTASLRLSLHSPEGEEAPGTAVEKSLSVHFSPALQVSFEDRVAAGTRSHGLPRRLTVKSLATTQLELREVRATKPEAGSPSRSVAALGPLGVIEPSASHTFALPPGDRNEGGESTEDSLVVHFRRAEALAGFFPWVGCQGMLPELSLPVAAVRWPLPSGDAGAGARAGGAASPGQLQVDLEHSSTGAVAEPLQVSVRVRRSALGTQEAQLRVLRTEGGDAADKFLLGGPTSTHVLLVATDDKQPQPCGTFTLVPLRPGWLVMPRVQVAAGGQEATSVPTSIFIFPCTQPCVPRAVA